MLSRRLPTPRTKEHTRVRVAINQFEEFSRQGRSREAGLQVSDALDRLQADEGVFRDKSRAHFRPETPDRWEEMERSNGFPLGSEFRRCIGIRKRTHSKGSSSSKLIRSSRSPPRMAATSNCSLPKKWQVCFE